MIRLLFAFLMLSLTASIAHASTTGSVGSPKVTAGKTELALRFGYSEADESSSEDERFRSRLHLDHGFNDFYAARVIVSQDRRKSDNLEHDAIGFENRFYLLQAKDHGFDFGVRAGYTHKDGDKKPSAVAFGLYGLVPLDAYELRLTQTFDREVGEDSGEGIGTESRFQLTRSIAENHRAGIEGFHDFNNLSEQSGYSAQSHTIGPVFKGKLTDSVQYETGYRTGISEAAPDHLFKFFVSSSF